MIELSDDVETSQAFQLRASFALGSLNGSLGLLEPKIAHRFAFALVRRTLIVSLEDAGYVDAKRTFDRWLAGGAPPLGNPQASATPETLVGAILAHLQGASWSPLAAAAAFWARALPHLAGRAGDALADLYAAADLVAAASGDSQHVWQDVDRMVEAARRSPLFATGKREVVPVEFQGQARLVQMAAPRGAVWALNIALGSGLARAKALPVALPLPRAISAAALRADLEESERQVALAQSVAAAAGELLKLLYKCRNGERQAEPMLAPLRRSSRAPLAHAALAEVGPLSVAQLARGLHVTRLGARGMLHSLREYGLAEQIGSRWQACSLPTGNSDASPAMPLEVAAAAAEVDAAIAAIDALLARQESLP